MRSSTLFPRRRVGACSPSTHRIASTTFDLPHPLGPTTAVIPGAKLIVVESRNDLKPSNSRLLRRMLSPPPPHHHCHRSLSQSTHRGSRGYATYRGSRDGYPQLVVDLGRVNHFIECETRDGFHASFGRAEPCTRCSWANPANRFFVSSFFCVILALCRCAQNPHLTSPVK